MAPGTSNRRPRVVLAEDQAPTLALLAQLLNSEFDVVAAVSDGQALVEAAAQLLPDAIVTDISMPVMDGIEAARIILGSAPSTRVVFVTISADPHLVRQAFAIGVLGYVAKVSAGDDLVAAVRAALRGERFCQIDSQVLHGDRARRQK